MAALASAAENGYDENNIFAKILNKTIPSYTIFETEAAIAILDAFPVAEGHALLLCKKTGFRDIGEMPAEDAAAYLRELPRLVQQVKQAFDVDAVNIISNCGAASGQVVFHPHVHVIPRRSEDGLLKLPGPMNGMIQDEAAKAVLEKLKLAAAS